MGGVMVLGRKREREERRNVIIYAFQLTILIVFSIYKSLLPSLQYLTDTASLNIFTSQLSTTKLYSTNDCQKHLVLMRTDPHPFPHLSPPSPSERTPY
jgi:hypothetical protein